MRDIIAGALFFYAGYALGHYPAPSIPMDDAIRTAYALGQQDLLVSVIEGEVKE